MEESVITNTAVSILRINGNTEELKLKAPNTINTEKLRFMITEGDVLITIDFIKLPRSFSKVYTMS